MCQSIPSCYDKGESSWWHDTNAKIRQFIRQNPGATPEEIAEVVRKMVIIDIEKFLDTVRQDLEWRRVLADDSNESKGVRAINQGICEFHEKILSAFAL